MRLDRAWIEDHIPHQGRMCLLDEVLDWDAEHITCRTQSHRQADHPLAVHGRLGIVCGIEYAAQAMAVHGALAALQSSAGGPPTAGFLASVRSVRMFAARLDEVAGDLICAAARVANDGGMALYEFELRDGTTTLLTGRATVVLDAGDRVNP